MILLRLVGIFAMCFCAAEIAYAARRGLFPLPETQVGGKLRYELLLDDPLNSDSGANIDSVSDPTSKSNLTSGNPAFHRIQFAPWISAKWEDMYTLRGEFRTWIRFPEADNTAFRSDVSVEDLSLKFQSSVFRATVGMQKVSWGENFGMNPADVVNPRDFREPKSFDLSQAKVPLGMANAQLFLGDWDLQVIYAPLPRTLPHTTDYSWFYNSEGGFRTGYRLGDVVVQGFFYRHWNRTPVPALDASTGIPQSVLLNNLRVNSYGLSSNAALNDWILRGDIVVNEDEPVFAGFAREPERHNVTYVILGTDRSFANNIDLGLQIMNETWDKNVPTQPRIYTYWAGVNGKAKIPRTEFDSEILFFHGTNNNDFWLRSRLNWNVNAGWKIGVEGNLTGADSQSSFPSVFAKRKSALVFAESVF